MAASWSPLDRRLGEPRAALFLGCPTSSVVTPLLYDNSVEFSLTEVSLVLEDLSLENSLSDGRCTPARATNKLENEVMVDPWSSMESSNSPLTDSGPSAGSEESTPSASEPAERRGIASASASAAPRNNKTDALHSLENTKIQTPIKDQCPNSKPSASPKPEDKPRARDLTLDLENLDPELAAPRRRHFLDEDFQHPLRSNIDACRIPKPHFLDHSPSPDEFDERSDITNPNFLDEDPIDICDDSLQSAKTETHRRSGALPKRPDRPHKVQSSHFPVETDRPHRTHYRSHLHYGLERAAHSTERDKRASQLYHGTWPGDGWPGQDTASVRSFSSAGSANAPHSGSSTRQSAHMETKMECVYSLLSLLSLSPDNNADLSGPLLEMSKSVDSCVAMRQSGCIPLLVQLIHSKFLRDTRNKAAQALHNIIHTQPDDKSGRREARVWRLLEQVREYCYILEDTAEAKKENKESIDEDMTRHPSQCVAALMKLSFDEEHRHVVCQLGGLQALATLVSADQAAHGSHIEEGTCVTMRKYAGMTLTNLTFGDGNNKSLLCSFKDFMLALVEQLQSPNDDMRQVTSAVLRNLSWRADNNSKQVLREVGAVKGLTEAAMTCQKEATLKSVLSALWNLTAHCSMNKVALCSVDGALGFLVEMLSYNSPTKTLAIVENAGGIMRNVSSHIAVREDYRQILRERNCLSVLLQHLKSPSLTVVSNSCGTLWNLSARCPLDQQFLWDHGAVPMLRSLIHSKHKMIAMGSSAALKNLLNSKPGKNHIISLDFTARSMNLPVLPTLGARKQKALEQEIDQNLAETCDNIEPATSPSTTNRDEKNLFSATERQLAMNLERHRMTSSSPLMGNLASQTSLSHSAHLAGYLSCSNTLLKSSLVTRSVTGSISGNVNRSDSKDSVTSAHSDSVFEKATRTAKVPIPTPRSTKIDDPAKSEFVKHNNDGTFLRYPTQPPVPPPRSGADVVRNNFTESGYDVDQDSCDQPIDFSRKYSETKSNEPSPVQPLKERNDKPDTDKSSNKNSEDGGNYGDYQETDLDQPTDYSLRYAEHQSEASSDSEPLGPSVHEDTIQHFCTEGTPYETPIIFSTATSVSDLRVIGGRKDQKKPATNVKTNSEVMTQSDEKDTCSIEEPPHDNDVAVATSKLSSPPAKAESVKATQFDTKFSSGMISPEKPVNYCDEGTPGCFSRVSSLSSLGDLADETNLAKKNAIATINMDMDLPEKGSNTSAKDKDGSKAVTFATEPAIFSQPESDTPGATSVCTTSPPPQGFVEDTPLMFSRCSSPSSLSGCSIAEPMDDQGSVVSEISRLTSGCISPSEIPDSPGQSIPQSPRPRARVSHPGHPTREEDTTPQTPPAHGGLRSVFEERVSTFQVENTPAQFSTATSLSSLTIDDEPSAPQHGASRDATAVNGATLGQLPEPKRDTWSHASQVSTEAMSTRPGSCDRIKAPLSTAPAMMDDDTCVDNNLHNGVPQPADTCRMYFTEDTPAVLSKTGSDGNLSALSVETSAEPLRPVDTSSDSSNLSDSGENLLNECIQKGIAKVLKNGSYSTDPLTVNIPSYLPRDQLYRSLPPYLRTSTETVKMQADFALPRSATVTVCHAHDSSPDRIAQPLLSDESPPPPLPPKFNLGGVIRPPPRPPTLLSTAVVAPASPPVSLGSDDERIFNQAIQQGIDKLKERKESRLPVKTSSTKVKLNHLSSNLVRNDSLSSLSIESFGSTDREIFEECVKAGVSKVNPKAVFTLDTKNKAHSVERVLETDPYRSNYRSHKSLDRSDKITNHRPYQSDLERLAPMHQKKDKTKKKDSEGMTRASHSYHGDTAAHSLAQHSRWGAPRYRDDGPPSLPIRIESHPHAILERSNSLSSLSGESFGSTDKEVFDKIVKLGIKSIPKTKDDIQLDRPDLRGGDFRTERPNFRLGPEVRESYRSRQRRSDLLPHIARPSAGALDKMMGEEDSNDRALLEEMIARGAGEIRPLNVSQSKNVQAPSVGRAPADGGAAPRDESERTTPHTSTPRSGSDSQRLGLFNSNISYTTSPSVVPDISYAHSPINIIDLDNSNMTHDDDTFDVTVEFDINQSNELPTVDSGNTTIQSTASAQMDRSNEYPAILSANTTLESEKDFLNKSNESYADVLDGSAYSDIGSPPENNVCTTLTQSNKNLKWTEINMASDDSDKKAFKKSTDTWTDNTCPDDVTFPTISGSVPMVASFKSDAADVSTALPDLLEESLIFNRSFLGPDLTDQLDEDRTPVNNMHTNIEGIQNEREPRFNSLVNDVSNFDSIIVSSIIEREAAQLFARLSNGLENHAVASSGMSYDLDSVKPPSNMGSLVSLTQSISGQLEDSTSLHGTKKSRKSRKKSLPISLMVKRALTNSMTYHSSNEHLDSCPVSILDNVKPPSEMDHMDMESSMISVASIASEVADQKDTNPVVFDFDQPVSGFMNSLLIDLDHVNPPSLFDELGENTLEFEQSTAQEVYDDCISNTLNMTTDLVSGSENCSPLQSDLSSVESTPKRVRNSKYLTPKEKRQLSKERYQTYTIADENTDPTDVTIAGDGDNEEFGTLESDSKSEDYATARSEHKSKRKISAKQRRLEDRARYQTQTVNISSIPLSHTVEKSPDPEIENLKRRLAAKKSVKQKRIDDAERFRTRIIGDDIPPSPTYVTYDANFENFETTTGYDSLSSSELNHQKITDDRPKSSDDNSTVDLQADSGTNDDDFELNSTQMQTYTKSFRNYLPVIESPTAVDICVVNNLKNIEMTASYRKTTPTYNIETIKDAEQQPGSSDFNSYDAEDNSDQSDSDPDTLPIKVKPKITKPGDTHRDASLDSNGSCENETPKGIRGRRKPVYVSPYKRNIPVVRKSPVRSVVPKSVAVMKPVAKFPINPIKTPTVSKTPTPNNASGSKIPANIPPKKTPLAHPAYPSTSQKVSIHVVAIKPLPIERQGTFTKEESTVLLKERTLEKKTTVPARLAKTGPIVKQKANTSPSRLPQPKAGMPRPPLRKTLSNEPKPAPKRSNNTSNRTSLPAMKNSASNQSLQSNDSAKTVTLASKSVSRNGSTTNVNSAPTKVPKDVASKIANLWKRVEQSKQQQSKPDKRVWIGHTDTAVLATSETPKLIRSSTFDGPPAQNPEVVTTPKTKSSIAIRVSQIPSSRYGSRPGTSKTIDKPSVVNGSVRRATGVKVFTRKQLNTQEIAT